MATVAGWCGDDDHLEEVKKRTHDLVIDLLGDRRLGGVTWIIRRGAEANALLDRMVEDTTEQVMLDHYRQIRGHLREYGGIVVVATAPGAR